MFLSYFDEYLSYLQPPVVNYSTDNIEEADWLPGDLSLFRVLRTSFSTNYCTITKLLENRYKCKEVSKLKKDFINKEKYFFNCYFE